MFNSTSGTVKSHNQENAFSGFRLIGFLISGILGEISLKVFLSVLNVLRLKNVRDLLLNYDEIHNFERRLNLRHTTLENRFHLYRDLSATPQ